MDVTIKDIEITPVNEELDQYRVDVRFQCNDCNYEYLIGDEDKNKCEEFIQSLKTGLPTKYIGCPKCDDKKNKKYN